MLERTDLHALARRIEVEHNAVGSALQSALGHAIAAGKLLIEAKASVKASVGHGHWTKWLASNTSVPPRTATHYMRLAGGIEMLCDQNGNVLPISVGEALHALKGNTNPWPGHGYSGHDSEWGDYEPYRGWGVKGWGPFGEKLRTVLDLLKFYPPATRHVVRAARAGKTPGLSAAALRVVIALLTRYADALDREAQHD
jgi:Protein of unknown function (DUF3102)